MIGHDPTMVCSFCGAPARTRGADSEMRDVLVCRNHRHLLPTGDALRAALERWKAKQTTPR